MDADTPSPVGIAGRLHLTILELQGLSLGSSILLHNNYYFFTSVPKFELCASVYGLTPKVELATSLAPSHTVTDDTATSLAPSHTVTAYVIGLWAPT